MQDERLPINRFIGNININNNNNNNNNNNCCACYSFVRHVDLDMFLTLRNF